MQRLKQFSGIILGAGLVIGLKLWNKASTHDDMKAALAQKCGGEAACTAAVDTYFDSCFDENYTVGGRRTEGGVNADGFLRCFNEKSGQSHFTLAH
jgi:hypothetical protein